MRKQDGTKHNFFRKLIGFGFHHNHRVIGRRNDQIEVAFGNLFGFVGVLIAVQTAAVIGVLMRFFIGRYLESELYSGGAAAPVPKPQDGTE